MKIIGFMVAFICVTISLGNSQATTSEKPKENLISKPPVADSIAVQEVKSRMLDEKMYRIFDRTAENNKILESKIDKIKKDHLSSQLPQKSIRVPTADKDAAIKAEEYFYKDTTPCKIIYIHDTIVEKIGIFGRRKYTKP